MRRLVIRATALTRNTCPCLSEKSQIIGAHTRTIDGPRSSSASAAASPPTRKLVDFRRVDSAPSDEEPISHPCSGDPDERSGADGDSSSAAAAHQHVVKEAAVLRRRAMRRGLRLLRRGMLIPLRGQDVLVRAARRAHDGDAEGRGSGRSG